MEGEDLVGSYQELGNPSTRLEMTSFLNGEKYIRAIFGRANYKFKNKYIIGVSLRRDGSSKFSSDYRWGTFTAYSAGWILSEESFMKGVPAISLLKIRGSFGQTGNEAIKSERGKTIYENKTDHRYGHEDLVSQGTRVTNIGNPALTWETTNSYDVGIDFGILENRINGSVAYYHQLVEDMLLAASIPPSSGLSGKSEFWDNVGDMKNYGWEFEVSSINIDRNDFRWSTQFNITTNDNEVLKLTPELDRNGAGIIDGQNITKTGGKVEAYYLADYAHVDPEKGVEMIHEIDIDHYNETKETIQTGRLIPATFDNTSRHEYIHQEKTPNPTYFGGFTNTFSYKGFELNIFFTFSGGNYIYDYNRKRVSFIHNGQNVILKELLTDAWREPGQKAKYPQITFNSTNRWGWDAEANDGQGDWIEAKGVGNYSPEQRFYSKWLYKADYIRLRNLQVAYRLPADLIQNMGLGGARFYISGTNLLTITDYPGYDPEGSTWIDTVPVPNLKTYSFGVSLDF